MKGVRSEELTSEAPYFKKKAARKRRSEVIHKYSKEIDQGSLMFLSSRSKVSSNEFCPSVCR